MRTGQTANVHMEYSLVNPTTGAVVGTPQNAYSNLKAAIGTVYEQFNMVSPVYGPGLCLSYASLS